VGKCAFKIFFGIALPILVENANVWEISNFLWKVNWSGP
jgi:hypothetical protein